MVSLRWFRKHQKGMLVVFGVVLMVAFVILPIFVDYGGGMSAEQVERFNEPIVRWSGGTLTRGHLQGMLEVHFGAMNLQQALIEIGLSGNPRGPIVSPISPIADVRSVESADRSIFARFMMAQYGREALNMVISDDAVFEFLTNLARTDLTQRDLVRICREVNPRIGYGQVHEHLKMELAAMRVENILSESFFVGNSGGTPASLVDAWQAYQQNERQIECAVVPFPVADAMAQVTETPPASELRRIYDEGKSADQDLLGEKPGFKRPRKVRIEYIVAEGSAFLDLAVQDVTPEQVQAEYNRLVEAKDPLVMEDVAPGAPLPDAGDGEALQDDPAPEMPAPESGDAVDDGNDPAPAPVETQDSAAPDATDPQPDPAAPSDSAPESPPPGDQNAPPAEKDDGDGSKRLALPWQFVSLNRFQEEGATPPQESEPAESPPGQSQDDPPSPPPEGAPAGEAMENAQEEPAPSQAPAEGEAPGVSVQEPLQRPKKLDAELELRIKQQMKSADALARQRAAVEKVRNAMNDYTLLLSDHESTKTLPAADRAPMPERLDMEALAKQHHMNFGATELCSYDDLVKTPIGMATEFRQDPVTRQFGTRRVADEVFYNFDRKTVFTVDELNSLGDAYVYWLTEKVESRIPSFEEANSEVVEFWKRRKATEKAREAAEKARQEVTAAGKPLAEVFPDRTMMTGGFRWFQAAFGQVNYGAPVGVQNAGEEFMSVAFGLEPQEMGVALNDDRSIVYLIQLVEADRRSPEALRDQFLTYVASVRQVVPSPINAFYSRKAIDEMIDHMNEVLDVQWIAY